jgi:hypothetical protein
MPQYYSAWLSVTLCNMTGVTLPGTVDARHVMSFDMADTLCLFLQRLYDPLLVIVGAMNRQPCREVELVPMQLAQSRMHRVRQIAKPNPDVAARITSEKLASDLLVFRWQAVIHTIWIHCLGIPPCDRRSLGVDFQSFAPSLRKVFFNRLGYRGFISQCLVPFKQN